MGKASNHITFSLAQSGHQGLQYRLPKISKLQRGSRLDHPPTLKPGYDVTIIGKFRGLNIRGPRIIREIWENYAPRKYGAIRYVLSTIPKRFLASIDMKRTSISIHKDNIIMINMAADITSGNAITDKLFHTKFL